TDREGECDLGDGPAKLLRKRDAKYAPGVSGAQGHLETYPGDGDRSAFHGKPSGAKALLIPKAAMPRVKPRPTKVPIRHIWFQVLFPRAGRRVRFTGGRVQHQFLDAPVGDLAYVQLVVFAAIHFMDGAEFLELLAAGAEFAEEGAIEFHLIYRCRAEILGVGVGGIQILVRAGSDAQGPGRTDVGVLSFQIAISVEDLNAIVAAVSYIDVVFGIHDD